MDNTWQMKCDSGFQSTTSATVSNVPSPEPRVQTEINASDYLFPQVAHGLRSKFAGGKQGHVYPSFLHSIANASGHADAGNSFLTLLYGPPSLLQGNLQEMSDHQLCSSSRDCTAAIGNFAVDSIESGAFLSSSRGVVTENLINHNLNSWANTFPEVSTRAMVDLSGGNDFVFRGIRSSNNTTQPMIAGGEKARESFSSSGQCQGTSPTSSINVCCADIQTAPNMAFEQFSSKYATPSMNGCPRVFCMEKSGYLLLSNTGLLGIVCSCHYCHMSVLKFCEHSGLHSVNPGEAVRMESGETILQWQKLYFPKLGIRSPGNESEWDWPEVLSTTGSLMKSNASASDISKTDLSRILSASALLRKQPTTIQDGFNIPLKGFTGISQNNLYDRVKRQLMESNLAMYTTTPNYFGTQQDSGCQPIPTFLDSLKGKGNSSTAYSCPHYLSSLLNGHECIKKKNVKDALVGRDAASSNIELRLGQPPQTGNPVPSFIEPPLKQMISNLSREEELQNNFNHAAGSFKMVEEQSQLKPRNYMSAVSNALGTVRARSEANNVGKDLLHSPFPQFNNQPRGKTKAGENLVNNSERIMPTMQFGLSNVPWNSNGHTGRQLNKSSSGNTQYLDNDKGESLAKDSCAKIDSGFGINQLREYPNSITRAVGGSDNCISVVNGKVYESTLPSDTFVGANFLHGSKSVSSLGQDNHVTPQMAISFKGILGLPYLVSSSTSNQIPNSQQQQGINMDTYLLDENTRLLALTQILESSKQQHALYFHDTIEKQGRYNNISKDPHYMYRASISEQHTSDASLKLLQSRGTCGNPESIDDLEKLASLTGFNRCCMSGLAPIPLHSKEKESQCKHSFALQNEEPSLSLVIERDNPRSSPFEKCSKKRSNIHLGGNYTSARVNCYRSNFLPNASGESSSKMVSDLSRDLIHQNTLKEENIYFEQSGKLDGQDSIKMGSCPLQWKDATSKVRKAVCDATSLDGRATTGLDLEGEDGVHLGNISAKRIKRTIDMGDLLKEQENSNASSGCSIPVVSQASVEANKVDSYTVDTVDTGFVSNLVVEGSGVDQGWLSDMVGSERSVEFLDSTCRSYLKNGYLRVLNGQPCCSILDELKLLDSLIWKKDRDETHFMLSANCKTNQSKKIKKGLQGKKRKRNDVRILDASGIPSLLHKKNSEGAGILKSSSSLLKEMHFISNLQRSSNKSSFVQPSKKQEHTALSSKFVSSMNLLKRHHSEEVSYELESNSDTEFCTLPEVSGTKISTKGFNAYSFEQFQMQDSAYEEPENAKPRSFSCRKENALRIMRPVVCGKYGEICSGESAEGVPKPAKIVSLSKVLKTSKRCMVPTNGKSRLTSKKKWKRLSTGTNSGHCSPGFKTKEDNETQNIIICNETNVNLSKEDLERGCQPPVIYKEKTDTKVKQGNSIVNRIVAPFKVKSKEYRKERSINELTSKEPKVKDMLNCAEDTELGNTRNRNYVQGNTSVSIINSVASCCVCRSNSNDKINCLLECSRCLVRVHQACYGISTLPKKGCWCCRPCRTKSTNIACVLCGYGGGAMTRAVLSGIIVKSLLKVWNAEKDGLPKHPTSCEVFEHNPSSVSNFKVQNSITAGVLDPTVKQWVHMVCGLWTPGTRCPNVDTMSAFDVSGVSRPRADVVSS